MNRSRQDIFQFLTQTAVLRPWWLDPIFLFALLVALVVHTSLVFTSFIAGNAAPMASKDVTIAVTLTQNKVEEADFEAQANQKGGGELSQSHKMTTPIPTAATETTVGQAQQEMLEQLEQKKQLDFQERMLMTTLSWQKQSQDEVRKKEQEQQQAEQQRTSRAAMIASIEAQYAQRQQMYAKKQKIKTVTDIQAKQNAAANYLDKFRQKVEMFGNRYYPDSAKQQKLSGDVRLMVILNPQGGIRAIRLLESSGHPVLDEAAKASVRRAMPFGRFDAEMQKEFSELRIVRTWRFDAKDSVFDVQ